MSDFVENWECGENWNWKKSLRSEDIEREINSSASLKVATDLVVASATQWIASKYRPKKFKPKWKFSFHIQPGDSKVVENKVNITFGVKSSSSKSIVDAAKASIGFPGDVFCLKAEVSHSTTTTSGVETSISEDYTDTVAITYNNTDSSLKKVYYQLWAVLTYEDGVTMEYKTSYLESSFSEMNIQNKFPEQSARDAWKSLIAVSD